MFLWNSSSPLPKLLLWYLSYLLLPVLPPPWLLFLITHPGKPPTWLCLPATGTQIVAAHSWMGEW